MPERFQSRSSLSPDFEPAFRKTLDQAGPGKRFLSLVSGQRADASELNAILEQHDPAHIASIESAMRNVVSAAVGEVHSARGRMREKEARAFAKTLVTVAPALALPLSTHWHGFLREEALKSIQSLSGPFAMALVLRRLNDWVPVIRQAAVDLLDATIANPDAGAAGLERKILGCLELLLQPHRFGRVAAAELAVIDRLLAYPGVRPAWNELVLTSPLDQAPRYLRMGLRSGHCVDILPRLAAEGVHAGTRRIAVGAVLRGGIGWREHGQLQWRELRIEADSDAIADAALKDPSVEVQALALQYVLDTPESDLHAEATFRAVLSHPSEALGNRAAFGLRRLGIDLQDELQATLRGQTPPPFWAARLLSRNGGKADEIYDAYERSRQRPSIPWLGVLASMDHWEAIDELMQIAMTAEDHGLANRASKALDREGRFISFARLMEAAQNAEAFQARGLMRFVGQCSAIEICRIVAILVRNGAQADFRGLWDLAARKRMRGAFMPNTADVAAMEADMRGLDDVRDKARRVLGL